MRIILAALLLAFLPSCETVGSGGKADIGPIISAAVTFNTAGHPDREAKMREASAALDVLADGIVTRETVLTLLRSRLGTGDPKINALVTLLVGYFPLPNVGLPQNEQLSKLARDVAAAIRNGLPPAPVPVATPLP